MRTPTVRSSKVSAVSGGVYQRRDCKYLDINGVVTTPQGLVQAWTYDERPLGHNRAFGFYIALVYEGRRYAMHGPQVYTARGLTTVAARFARDVAAGRYGHA